MNMTDQELADLLPVPASGLLAPGGHVVGGVGGPHLMAEAVLGLREGTQHPPGLRSLLVWDKEALLHLAQRLLEHRKNRAPVLVEKDHDETQDRIADTPSGPVARSTETGDAEALMLGSAIANFERRLRVEPVGYIHLERIDFIPLEILDGEHIHSVPLAPYEDITLVHREWSNSSTEFTQSDTRSVDESEEQAVVEKSDIEQASSNQKTHTENLGAGVTATGTFGPVRLSAHANLDVSSSSTSSSQASVRESSEVTKKASRRVTEEHKVTFRTTAGEGIEDEATKKFKNPSAKPMRIDYAQLVRRWEARLCRYDVRLTYDIVIPNPGGDILAKVLKRQELENSLSVSFGDPNTQLEWARFTLTPSEITRESYHSIASKYGATVPSPPPQTVPIHGSDNHQFRSVEESKGGGTFAVEVDVEEDYAISSAELQVNAFGFPGEASAWGAHNGLYPVDLAGLGNWTPQPNLVGLRGKLSIPYGARWASAISAQVRGVATLDNGRFVSWQQSAWKAIYEVAERRYQLQRASIAERLRSLTGELSEENPAGLRKLEREEVMKNAKRWLLGPDFTFTEKGAPESYYSDNGSVISETAWVGYMAHGETIKFLNHAIEWESMLYFLYPYYWGSAGSWQQRLGIEHPDFRHLAFLRSGAARVVLPIASGYERDFMSYVETGDIGNSHPYVTIAEEMERYAKTNYPGATSANPTPEPRPLLTFRQKKAWDEIQAWMVLIEGFKAQNGRYPNTGEGLAAAMPLTHVGPSLVDPWGDRYAYECPGREGDYDLSSAGGPRGSDAHPSEGLAITNWATASMVGRWYEHTPTSSLTIKVATGLPVA
ncbi:type II secretion system protein GspG [Phycicoccus sp. Soil802]|uniref:type II secretion system protein GspG n=1 Tax=Phycicoccus sp. Soil802 TaxID=1736414 RepID=UPI00138EE361|nr:type II secretion system protein GspG [Phycicoccus sp. Soil802]